MNLGTFAQVLLTPFDLLILLRFYGLRNFVHKTTFANNSWLSIGFSMGFSVLADIFSWENGGGSCWKNGNPNPHVLS